MEEPVRVIRKKRKKKKDVKGEIYREILVLWTCHRAAIGLGNGVVRIPGLGEGVLRSKSMSHLPRVLLDVLSREDLY